MKHPLLEKAHAAWQEKQRLLGEARTRAVRANQLAGSHLRELRMSLGLTIEQLRDKMNGLRVADLESGKQQVTPEILQRYERMLKNR